MTPWTVAYQVPPSMGFSRQEYWSGLPFPSPGDLPNPGTKPGSPALQRDALPSEPPGPSFNSQQDLAAMVLMSVHPAFLLISSGFHSPEVTRPPTYTSGSGLAPGLIRCVGSDRAAGAETKGLGGALKWFILSDQIIRSNVYESMKSYTPMSRKYGT